jgi:hypothetical protein
LCSKSERPVTSGSVFVEYSKMFARHQVPFIIT